MKRYELLDHTADAKFRAYGVDMADAFGNAAIALTAIATDPDKVESRIEKKISLEAERVDQLLYDFLDQLIFLVDTEHFIAADVRELSIQESKGELSLSAILMGDDVRRYGSNLKAVTYNEMEAKRLEDGSWMVQAVIDI